MLSLCQWKTKAVQSESLTKFYNYAFNLYILISHLKQINTVLKYDYQQKSKVIVFLYK